MKLTSKGQLTIPKKLRTKFGIALNSELDIVEDGNALRIIKRTGDGSPVDRVFGILKSRQSTDRLVKRMRGK